MSKWTINLYSGNNMFIAQCDEKDISTGFCITKEEIYFKLGTMRGVKFKDIIDGTKKVSSINTLKI